MIKEEPVIKREVLQGALDEGDETKLVLSGTRAGLPGQKRKRAVDVVSHVCHEFDEC